MRDKKIILVFGPPGSGKDTQAEKISEKLDIPFISSGDMLRREVKKGTDLSKKIKTFLAKGKLIPTPTMNTILEHRLEEKDIQDGFVLNGYPRKKIQLEFMKKKIEKWRQEEPITMLAFHVQVSNKEVQQRLGGRRVCSNCGSTYHIKYKPPKQEGVCDKCGHKLEQREDDKPEVIEKRLDGFYERIDPILTYFRKNGNLIEIDGEQSIEEVEKEIEEKGLSGLN